MNFDEAIRAHTDWRIKLLGSTRNPSSADLDAVAISKDNVCELGKWIYGEGKTYVARPEFKEPITAHAEFHKAAGNVVTLVKANQRQQAEQMLNDRHSPYGQASSKVMTLLMKMRTVAK
jgi:hypothetical protein